MLTTRKRCAIVDGWPTFPREHNFRECSLAYATGILAGPHFSQRTREMGHPMPQALKPPLILCDLRGAEAPLYHGVAGVSEFFPQPV